MLPKICSFPECTKPHSCKGYCNGHYAQMRNGKPLKALAGSSLSPKDRFMSKVEKTPTCWNWVASTSRGYGHFPLGGTKVLAHRYAYELWVAPIPEGLAIDHICHNRACVNPNHLRVATYKENNEHRQGAEKTNSVGIRGVSWSKSQKAYRARVTHDDKTYHLGYFTTAEEAGEVARLKRLELFTHNDVDRITK